MITKGDDFPIHQRSEPIAYSGTDRNFYDRYFFNGYTRDGSVFFALALGIYPHLNVKDAAFCVVVNGVQHNLRASAELRMERLDMSVGPIAVDVVEPLEVLRLRVSDARQGISAELTFRQRGAVVEEPRFVRRAGPRTLQDYTRMTQAGSYDGYIEIAGNRIAVSAADCVGTRDRSWGIRPIGTRDSQPATPATAAQFYWLWAPVNFDHFSILFGRNEDASGNPWHHNMAVVPRDDSAPVESFGQATISLNYLPGERYLGATDLRFGNPGGEEIVVRLTPRFHFYMSGLGYLHPRWGHGMYHGGDVCGYDVIEPGSPGASQDPLRRHVQTVVDAVMFRGGKQYQGQGVLEQLVIGCHAPSGFHDDAGFGVGRSG
jgi:hypothetical protein